MKINDLLTSLAKAGVPKDQLGAVATKLAKSGALQNQGGVGNIVASIIGSSVADKVIGSLSGGQAPANTVPMGGKGYIYTPQDQFQYEQYYYSLPQTIARSLGREMQTPDERRAGQIAISDLQLETANRRQRELQGDKLAADIRMKEAEVLGNLQQQRIAQEGALGVQELSSLGDVQKQRVQSGYEAASSMLQKAIENIAYVEKLGQSDTRKQLAALPSI